jgi:hypothetical protein
MSGECRCGAGQLMVVGAHVDASEGVGGVG